MKLLFRTSLSCFLLAVLLGIYKGSNTTDVSKVTNKVQKPIEAIITNMEGGFKKTHAFLSAGNPEFTEFLNLNLPLSCMVFDQNRTPVFWNDPVTSFPENCLRITDSLLLTEQTNGIIIFLSKKIIQKEKIFYVCFYKYLKTSFPVQNKYVKSQPEPGIFSPDIADISLIKPTENNFNCFPVTYGKRNLFYVHINSDTQNTALNYFFIILIIVSGLGFYYTLFLYYCKTAPQYPLKNILRLFSLLVSFLLLRFLMFHFNFPFSKTEWELFSPSYFAILSLVPSLGDLLLTVLLLYPIIWLLFDSLLHTNFSSSRIGLLTLAFCFTSVLFLYFFLAGEINFQPHTSLRIHEELNLNYFSLLALWIEVFTALFIFCLLLKILSRINNDLPVINFILKNKIWILPSFLFIVALLHTLAVSVGYDRTQRLKKINYVNNLLSENDFLGEYYINQAGKKISDEPGIQNKFLRPAMQEDFLVNKIKNQYLNRYFDKYEVGVRVYRRNGNRVRISSADNYFEVLQATKNDWIPTEYEGLYLMPSRFKEQSMMKAYRYFLTITSTDSLLWPYAEDKKTCGHILINFRLNRSSETSIIPRLFYDEKYDVAYPEKNFDYALIENDSLVLTSGSPNISFIRYKIKHLKKNLLINSEFVHEDVYYSFHRIKANDFLIISGKHPGVSDYLSVFSFYFIFLAITFACFYFIVNKFVFSKTTSFSLLPYQSANSFTFRIQMYLMIASFLPLVIVLLSSILITIVSHKTEFFDKMTRKAENMHSQLSRLMDNFSNGSIDTENINKELMEYRQISGLDINLFNHNGKLVASTQPLLFQFHFKPELVNPLTHSAFLREQKNNIVTDESICKLHFNGIYVRLKSPVTNKYSGTLYIPYFESDEDINKELASVISTILIIYIPVFILLLIFGNIFSRQLIIPLKLLTGGLQEISLTKPNKPLQWKSDDEIGKLVTQYNDMLEKLEGSKQKLSKNERELAWKEAAQKVAHEIKNPLTPMRLNLQHLERAIKENHPGVLKMTNKVITTLITQIDIINDIASSFSKLAKLPSPNLQKVNLHTIINEQAFVFINSGQADISIHIEKENSGEIEFTVMADPKELAGVFSNLLLNAIQSVSEGVFPVIEISISHKEGRNHVCINDNGRGMDSDTQLHAFEHGYTTKKTGAGIGLSLCRNIIENLGGKIWFDTSVGKGTKFQVLLD